MEMKEIKQILKLMDEYGLAEFTLERDGEKLIIKSQTGVAASPAMITPQVIQPAIQAAPVAREAEPAPAAPPPQKTADDALQVITSPMVGTFYAAPSPDSEPYVQIGASVTPESTVCVIEAMKIMNEIKAEVTGMIMELCVGNGQPVEFGQALFKVKVK
jgi:acetyl-CoA carboxylase biotin carboxyl carrier protein